MAGRGGFDQRISLYPRHKSAKTRSPRCAFFFSSGMPLEININDLKIKQTAIRS